MAQRYLEIIKKLGKNRVKTDEPLAKHTTFGIGGPADLYYEAKTTSEIIAAVKLAQQYHILYFILGGGSNLLVSDEGFRGIVIKIKNADLRFKNERAVVGAGLNLGQLVKETTRRGLLGLEFTAGIPGTVGGAVRGNAGAWRQNIGDGVVRVKVLDENNRLRWLSRKDCHFSYRQSRFKKSQEIILEAELTLVKGQKQEIKQKIAEYLQKRRQDPKEPSAGCIFVNPKTCPAGKLIEACGLKGKRIGQAQISPRHANFIVNLGGAKAEDVLELTRLVKGKVKEKFGVNLEKEICLLGFDRIERKGN